MARKIVSHTMKIALAILLLSTSVFAQKVHNFDKTVTVGDPSIVIAPPAGQTWRLLRGSFAINQYSIALAGGVNVTIFEQHGNDPGLCTNLIRVKLSDAPWIPIVGGYTAHPVWGNMRGQDAPIVLKYPNRLVIHVGGLQGSLETLTRFTIQ